MKATSVLLLAAVAQFPTLSGELECFDYALFDDVIKKGGGKLTQTIETPSFPSFKRLMIVTMQGTKQVFGAYETCVLVPPLFVDHPDGMDPVPVIDFTIDYGRPRT